MLLTHGWLVDWLVNTSFVEFVGGGGGGGKKYPTQVCFAIGGATFSQHATRGNVRFWRKNLNTLSRSQF